MTKLATSITVFTTEIIAAYVENNRVEADAYRRSYRPCTGL